MKGQKAQPLKICFLHGMIISKQTNFFIYITNWFSVFHRAPSKYLNLSYYLRLALCSVGCGPSICPVVRSFLFNNVAVSLML
ncbi:hypothetical protein BGX38DRAFT_528834 [Terfezia claveryi]|nr:hypothetical protein BGX38DRAFT_528834 [Terfezia claveryi]